jgi:hypothetical protein
MQVIERLVGNDARRHIHDVPFGDRLGLGVAVERRAEQGHRGRRRRGGEGDEELIAVMLADDLGDLFFGPSLRFRHLRCLLRRQDRPLSERHTDGGPHAAFLRAVRLIDQKRDAQGFSIGLF